jgi:hypothetical protein
MRRLYQTESGISVEYNKDLDTYSSTCECGRRWVFKGCELAEFVATRYVINPLTPFKPWPPSGREVSYKYKY